MMSSVIPPVGRVARATIRLSSTLLGAAVPLVAWAACTCGSGDGLFTLATIGVDGNLSDWASVHADPDNNACDGPGGGLADRDAPVQSTGRDLTHFALTWDQNNLYLFTERVGSASNVQRFVYYADTDNDELMETGEPVLGAEWKGNTGLVSIYLFDYVAQSPGGDSMVDAQGYGDGYTLPGSFANIPKDPLRSGTWGSASGIQMEFAIAWSELGLAPGSALTFHVSSSNASLGSSSFTAQIDDNLSGCGGGLGSTRIPGVQLTPDRDLAGLPGQLVVAPHTLENAGNSDDSYDFSAVISGAHTPAISYYEDTDGDGALTAADQALGDTDGDGEPDTGVLSPGTSMTVLIAYQIDLSATGIASIDITASSNINSVVSASVIDTVTVIEPPSLVVQKTVETLSDPVNGTTNPMAIPGAEMRYRIGVINQGAGTVDAGAFAVTDPIPTGVCLMVDDATGPGSGPVQFVDGTPSSTLSYNFIALSDPSDDLAFSDDGGISYSYSPTPDGRGCDPAVTDIRINPQGVLAADTGAGSPNAEFLFRVLVN